MKRILSVLIVCMVLLCSAFPGFADASFTVEAKVDFDNSTVTVTVNTPAQYDQHILIAVYPKGDSISEPEQYIRIGEVFASREGKAELVLNFAGVTLGDYTVSATGGGYLAEECHAITDIYFETTEDLNNVTLPAVSTAAGDELNSQLIKLQTYFGVDLGDGYASDPSAFLKYFETIRTEDYNNSLDTMNKVQETADRVNIIMTTLQSSAQSKIQELYESNDSALSFDKNGADYKVNKEELYSIYLGLVDDNSSTIVKMGDLRKLFRQAMGMVVINSKNAENVTDVIVAYGDAYGIPVESYTEYCETYGDVDMNMNFIGRNFTKPDEVLAAYNAAVDAVTKSDDSRGGDSLSSSGGGGSRVSKVIDSGKSAATPEPQETAAFTDVPAEHWAYEPVKALSAIGVINGSGDGSFQPDADVTREQFVKMLVTAFKLTASEETAQSFNDVPSGHWAEEFIQTAAGLKLVSGVSETEFGLGASLTRQDAAVLIDRVLTHLNKSIEPTGDINFTDWELVSAYAAESVTKLCSAGIVNGMGDGSFAPALTLTRAQAAKILYGVLSLH